LIAEETVQPVEIGGWKLEGTANDAIQDLIYFTQGFVQFLITLRAVYTLPALVLVAIPLYSSVPRRDAGCIAGSPKRKRLWK
jgi:hypothetical protein